MAKKSHEKMVPFYSELRNQFNVTYDYNMSLLFVLLQRNVNRNLWPNSVG